MIRHARRSHVARRSLTRPIGAPTLPPTSRPDGENGLRAFAFALSFDEIIVSNLRAGACTQTVPMWILTAIQRPNELPVANVVALVLIVVSVVPVWLASRISADGGSLGRT